MTRGIGRCCCGTDGATNGIWQRWAAGYPENDSPPGAHDWELYPDGSQSQSNAENRGPHSGGDGSGDGTATDPVEFETRSMELRRYDLVDRPAPWGLTFDPSYTHWDTTEDSVFSVVSYGTWVHGYTYPSPAFHLALPGTHYYTYIASSCRPTKGQVQCGPEVVELGDFTGDWSYSDGNGIASNFNNPFAPVTASTASANVGHLSRDDLVGNPIVSRLWLKASVTTTETTALDKKQFWLMSSLLGGPRYSIWKPSALRITGLRTFSDFDPLRETWRLTGSAIDHYSQDTVDEVVFATPRARSCDSQTFYIDGNGNTYSVLLDFSHTVPECVVGYKPPFGQTSYTYFAADSWAPTTTSATFRPQGSPQSSVTSLAPGREEHPRYVNASGPDITITAERIARE